MDMGDVSWIDKEDGSEDEDAHLSVRVKTLTKSARPGTKPGASSQRQGFYGLASAGDFDDEVRPDLTSDSTLSSSSPPVPATHCRRVSQFNASLPVLFSFSFSFIAIPERGLNGPYSLFILLSKQTRKPSAVEGEHNLNRMQSWAKVEGRSRNAGTTGRSVGGSAVTGHAVKSGGGSVRSVRSAHSASSRASGEQRRPLKAVPSMLSGLADRSTRFTG